MPPRGNNKLKDVPHNMATIDHIDPKGSRERGKHAGEYRKVLSCIKCNNERDKEFTASLPIEELHKRSGRSGSPYAFHDLQGGSPS